MNGSPFTRDDNCRRHMRLKHGLIDGDCEMDELTKKIRGERKKKRRNGVDHEL
jgi:hypothetical protein